MVMSRWGVKLHKANCPCGVCISKRKKQHTISKENQKAEPDEDVSYTTVLTAMQTSTVAEESAPAKTACDAAVLAQSLHLGDHQGELGVLAASAVNAPTPSTTPATSATAKAADAHARRSGKSAPKVFLCFCAVVVLVHFMKRYCHCAKCCIGHELS